MKKKVSKSRRKIGAKDRIRIIVIMSKYNKRKKLVGRKQIIYQ